MRVVTGESYVLIGENASKIHTLTTKTYFLSIKIYFITIKVKFVFLSDEIESFNINKIIKYTSTHVNTISKYLKNIILTSVVVKNFQ